MRIRIAIASDGTVASVTVVEGERVVNVIWQRPVSDRDLPFSFVFREVQVDEAQGQPSAIEREEQVKLIAEAFARLRESAARPLSSARGRSVRPASSWPARAIAPARSALRRVLEALRACSWGVR